nr:septation protein IspZ [uncultured Bdellovibrio sp.]
MKLLKWILGNFGPMIVFYGAVYFWNLKVAIFLSLLVTVIEIVRFKIQKKSMSPFFIFSSGMALLFGILDLTLQNAFFFKFEAGISNLVCAVFFGLSLFHSKSLVQEIAEQQGKIDKTESPDKHFFFRIQTIAWTIYFIAKAILYTWVNFNTSLQEALVIRLLVGNVSFYVMMFISVGLARPLWIFMEKMRWMPSARMYPHTLQKD